MPEKETRKLVTKTFNLNDSKWWVHTFEVEYYGVYKNVKDAIALREDSIKAADLVYEFTLLKPFELLSNYDVDNEDGEVRVDIETGTLFEERAAEYVNNVHRKISMYFIVKKTRPYNPFCYYE